VDIFFKKKEEEDRTSSWIRDKLAQIMRSMQEPEHDGICKDPEEV
jgi:hypothetical protein